MQNYLGKEINFENEDYRYTPKEIHTSRVMYMDTIRARRKNFLCSIPLGLLLMGVPRFRKMFPNKVGAMLGGSILSFMMLDFPNDFRFNEITTQIN